jgi:hypothetical protein
VQCRAGCLAVTRGRRAGGRRRRCMLRAPLLQTAGHGASGRHAPRGRARAAWRKDPGVRAEKGAGALAWTRRGRGLEWKKTNQTGLLAGPGGQGRGLPLLAGPGLADERAGSRVQEQRAGVQERSGPCGRRRSNGGASLGRPFQGAVVALACGGISARAHERAREPRQGVSGAFGRGPWPSACGQCVRGVCVVCACVGRGWGVRA